MCVVLAGLGLALLCWLLLLAQDSNTGSAGVAWVVMQYAATGTARPCDTPGFCHVIVLSHGDQIRTYFPRVFF